ncbi:hypothetical protein FisN_24Hu069 [Fistulifera solaris]|uniref:BTB domain-containing protein n=1 Tax=Fistulifera solaris TaxID=1519565 RepID=A0A1Z5JEQ6_FISSO|nr:hypothetical protein FisN_24Hu069 [Fistulifera solaris]|eukprot:GAX12494.1 hypothetical protein FisN_24Hu069 [Fistulifera solaris]
MEQEGRPMWRDDPSESFSDWTIEIVSLQESKYSGTYHVHRIFLAHGPKRSDYFSTLIRSEDGFHENQTNTSRIELDSLAAEAFPILLDYVYGFGLELTTKTATALHHLGEYFGIEPLRLRSLEFCRKNMSLHNLHCFYCHAERLNDAPVLKLVTDYLRDKVRPSHQIVERSKPQLWIEALGPDENGLELYFDDTDELSKVISKVCSSQSEETLDAETFCKLTEDQLFSVDFSVALDLCELADRYYENADEGVISRLLNFQDTCVRALANNWKLLRDLNGEQATQLSERSAGTLVELLLHTVENAWCEVSKLSSELADCKSMIQATESRELSVAKAGDKRLRPLYYSSSDDNSTDESNSSSDDSSVESSERFHD